MTWVFESDALGRRGVDVAEAFLAATAIADEREADTTRKVTTSQIAAASPTLSADQTKHFLDKRPLDVDEARKRFIRKAAPLERARVLCLDSVQTQFSVENSDWQHLTVQGLEPERSFPQGIDRYRWGDSMVPRDEAKCLRSVLTQIADDHGVRLSELPPVVATQSSFAENGAVRRLLADELGAAYALGVTAQYVGVWVAKHPMADIDPMERPPALEESVSWPKGASPPAPLPVRSYARTYAVQHEHVVPFLRDDEHCFAIGRARLHRAFGQLNSFRELDQLRELGGHLADVSPQDATAGLRLDRLGHSNEKGFHRMALCLAVIRATLEGRLVP